MAKPLTGAALLVAGAGASAAVTSAPGLAAPPCLAGKKSALLQGGFSGPLICSRRNATFNFVGKTTGHRFSLYDYRYRFRPADGNVTHGGQRIVIFHGASYMGQYTITTPPFTSVTVDGATMVLRIGDAATRVRLDLFRHPPKKILVNGKVATFFR